MRLAFCCTTGVFARKINHLPDDQHAAQGILADLGVHELVGKLDIRSLLILDPLVQVARGEDDVVEQPTALGDLGLESRFVQVLGKGLDDLLLMVLDAAKPSINHLQTDQISFSRLLGRYSRPVELAELNETKLDISGPVLQEGLANGGDALGNGLEGGKLQVGKLDTHIDFKGE